jgi:hypothetical protein
VDAAAHALQEGAKTDALQEQLDLLQSGIEGAVSEVSDRVKFSRGDPNGFGAADGGGPP